MAVKPEPSQPTTDTSAFCTTDKSDKQLTSILGFFLLELTQLALLILILFISHNQLQAFNYPVKVITIVIILTLIKGYLFVRKNCTLMQSATNPSGPSNIKGNTIKTSNHITNILIILATLLGTVVTYLISIKLNLGAVLAAAIVGTISSYILTFLNIQKFNISKLDVPIYCGAFAGMSSTLIFSNLAIVILAGTIAGLIFVITKNVFMGIGGKLGTIAFISVIIAMYLLSIFPNTSVNIYAQNHQLVLLSLLELTIITATSILASASTYYANIHLKMGGVKASALLSLIFAIIILLIKPLIGDPLATLTSVIFIGSSFVGMSSKDALKTILESALAGAIFAFLFFATNSVFAGYGGKLGTIAAISVTAMIGINYLKTFNLKTLFKNNI